MAVDVDRIQSVFAAAAALDDAAARAALLDRECGSDASMRRRVELLLKAHDDSGGLPAAGPAPTGLFDAGIHEGSVVAGRYKLLELIGEGGMGAVWLADQTEPVKRKVALKLVKPGMDSKGVLARFEAERQALALMDHQNIAQVHDGGVTEHGRPYFVMELVKGMPLTEYCDARRMNVRERLGLFVQICTAVQHAHQKGIIHRDLKPSNILVTEHDGRPVPKVIDFGLAKALSSATILTERTIHTAFGMVAGTPPYMAPEQVGLNALDVDTRVDVYALGVILYELLTGTTPLEKQRLKEAAWDEIRRVIREEEPPKPSMRLSDSHDALPSISAQRHTEPAALTRLVRGELDWIVMKALEKDRDRRYETANGFSMDVQRYLADEPVQACPPSTWYQFKKFVRRNKGPIWAAAIVLLTLVSGIVGTTLGLFRARQAWQAETQRAEGERIAKFEAKEREAETNAALEFVETKIFAAARPEGQFDGLGHDVSLRRAIEAALPFVEEGFRDRPLIEARLRLTLAKSFAYLDEEEIAAEQFRKARALYTDHRGLDHPDTLTSMNGLACSFMALGRYHDALKLNEETLALRKARLGSNHRDTLASTNNLGVCYYELGRHSESLKLREETVVLQKANLGPDDPDTLMGMGNLAGSYVNAGRYMDALRLNEETLALRKAKLSPGHPDTLASMGDVAYCYHLLGRQADAIKLYEETLALRTAKLGSEHSLTFNVMSNLADSYHALGRYADAFELRKETLARRKAKLGPDHPSTLKSMASLANSYHILGKSAEALKLREETLTLQKAKLGPHHPETLRSAHNLASSYHVLRRFADSLKLNEEILQLRMAKVPHDHPEVLKSKVNLAINYAALGRYADALRLHEEVLALRRTTLGPDHPDTLLSMHLLATSYVDLRRHAEAIPLHQETLARRRAKLGPDHPETLQTMHNIATSLASLGRDAEAAKLYEETLALRKTKLGVDHVDTLHSMHNLARSYSGLRRDIDAAKLYEETLALRRAKLGSDDANTLQSAHNLALSYGNLGRHADAHMLNEATLRSRKAKLGPDHVDTLWSMHNLALNYAALGRHSDALKLREETVKLRKAKLGPNHPQTLSSLSGLASSLIRCDRGAEAVLLIDDCVRRVGGETAHAALVRTMIDLRIRHFEKTMDVSGCLKTAEMWEGLNRTDAQSLYNAACYRAVTAALLRATDRSIKAAEQAAAEADRAMEWLRKAVAVGWANAAHMKQDADLNTLRDRDDFKKLIADVEAKTKK